MLDANLTRSPVTGEDLHVPGQDEDLGVGRKVQRSVTLLGSVQRGPLAESASVTMTDVWAGGINPRRPRQEAGACPSDLNVDLNVVRADKHPHAAGRGVPLCSGGFERHVGEVDFAVLQAAVEDVDLAEELQRRNPSADGGRRRPGAPICSTRPGVITNTRSARSRASSWSWVTKTLVRWISSCSRRSQCRSSCRTWASGPQTARPAAAPAARWPAPGPAPRAAAARRKAAMG